MRKFIVSISSQQSSERDTIILPKVKNWGLESFGHMSKVTPL